MKINRLALALCSLFFLLPTITIAQNRSLDKADADALVYEQLANNTGGEHFTLSSMFSMQTWIAIVVSLKSTKI